uniref:Peptide-methionine (R)-S-oxide reductase n=1 Tax=Proboscia inermis TaxID=420281 RepID=A0A7S0CCR8_9STRA
MTTSLLLVLLSVGAAAFTSPQNIASKQTANSPLMLQMESSPRRKFMKDASFFSGALLLSNTKPVFASDETITPGGKITLGSDDIMDPKAHGTSAGPAQENLRYGVSQKLADKICNFNRHFAENGGYFQKTSFEDIVMASKGPVTFYDSVTGKPLFVAPIGRSAEDFVNESYTHGWPSFRDQEVVWDSVRVLKSSGETVSVTGTHLGHNLPDKRGNRYCINLVSVAGNPV